MGPLLTRTQWNLQLIMVDMCLQNTIQLLNISLDLL
nr:MAG TPA: hypothetical protein [Bacteriophage sp.]